MKKLFIFCMTCMMLCSMGIGAFAEAPDYDMGDALFTLAKEAVSLMGAEDYEGCANRLPFSEPVPTADDWQNFVAGFTALAGTQTQSEISVAYWTDGLWYLAVPVALPENGSVEVVLFTSENGETFCAYSRAVWDDVVSAYTNSEYVIWNKEYVSATPILISD